MIKKYRSPPVHDFANQQLTIKEFKESLKEVAHYIIWLRCFNSRLSEGERPMSQLSFGNIESTDHKGKTKQGIIS
ncbi:hypothetical protein HMPREF7215_0354 [Pyramidobacter piscolens W5455]|uniref:Uncharacterized protein n=1 Tax=Pyramidobacter piscolens W5455 TaxID=352165 RepID=A0ABM9ZWH0_9BACT|nr:hypothetical protein HMPREF7215_0354 [Pyramidobacter piscolens W5455]